LKKIVLRLLALLLVCPGLAAFAQNSNAPIYSEIIPTSSGLDFDPATDIQEHFVAANGKTVEVLIKGPVGSGTYSRKIAPAETPDVYFPAVVAEALKAGAHHLVIPKGTYVFQGPKLCTDAKSAACNQPTSCNATLYYNCQPHWTIGQYPQGQVTVPNSITDLDIDFSGSELDFSAPVIGIWILEAQRLRLRNFTLDWPSLPIASLGTIVRDPENKGHNALVLDEQYPVEDKYQGGTVQIQAVDRWDDSNAVDYAPGTFDGTANNNFETYFIFGNAPQPTYVGKTTAGAHTFSCKSCHFVNSASDPTCSFFSGCANFDSFAPGARVIVRHYTYNGFAFLVNWSNDIDFENVKLRTGPGIGFSVSNNGGYRGFRIANSQISRGPGRVISTASDAIDISLKTDVIVEGNDIGYQGDDSLSIYPTTEPVSAVDGTKVTIPAVCDPDPMDEPMVGDSLAFFDSNYVYKGSARVLAAEGAFCASTLSLTLDQAIAGLGASDNLVDLTQQPTARYMVHNNEMHECRCHGVLVDAPYGLINRNVFFRNSAGAVDLESGSGNGPGATNLTIVNNVSSDPGQLTTTYGAFAVAAFTPDGSVIPSPVFEKIRIADNLIFNSPGPGIIVTSAKDIVVGPNWVFNANGMQANPNQYGTLSTLDAILIDQSSNGTVCGNLLDGPMTGALGIDPSDTKILIKPECASPVAF